MQFFTLAAVFFSLAAMPQLLVANPLEARGGGGGGGGGGDPPPPPSCPICPGTLYSLAKCCNTIGDPLGGILATGCVNPSTNPPTSDSDFRSDCAAVGRTPGCCTLGLLGIGLVCDARA
ncbi:hypothetical protein DFH08DRAFT_970651 [Mycena albidolilacea]|uniref:Hydrophobin n=1 Tax=Mycena albidolilacea TaxID=1033008 RepID=A0AAD6ZEF3_9AGAR|nr:hypothetical protein DFH08DRAFT_823890 [Mycena albidolilacea]KAJ7319253.1 hypothetical protein DFH08DRAFT_970651 [Mycena albidolilacea]